MDSYSVGSLADLISGSNTLNKPKVVKQAFKKFTNVDDVNEDTNSNTVVKKIKGNKAQKGLKKEKNIKKQRKVKQTITEENVVEQFSNDNESPIQIKKNKKLKKRKLGNDISSTIDEDSSPKTEHNAETRMEKGIKKAKQLKKRKLGNEENSTVDEDSSPPKKQKIIKTEHNAERRINKKIKEEKKVINPEEQARTIFVGNVPITAEKKNIKKHFKKYGKIESLRIRGIPVADVNTSKKVAAIKKEFNPNRSNVFCYIRFEDKESALKAEAENGALFEEHHLRVHSCTTEEKPDETKAIFVGNLSFKATEDELWNLFEPCGPISYVRIVRDALSGMGKGFGYVNFKDSDAVQLALGMENVKLNDRELRISLCNLNSAKRNKKNNKNKKITQPGKQKIRNNFRKKSEKLGGDGFTPKNKAQQNDTQFQGTKFTDKNKKNKINKGLLKKKKLVKKIAPKPK